MGGGRLINYESGLWRRLEWRGEWITGLGLQMGVLGRQFAKSHFPACNMQMGWTGWSVDFRNKIFLKKILDFRVPVWLKSPTGS